MGQVATCGAYQHTKVQAGLQVFSVPQLARPKLLQLVGFPSPASHYCTALPSQSRALLVLRFCLLLVSFAHTLFCSLSPTLSHVDKSSLLAIFGVLLSHYSGLFQIPLGVLSLVSTIKTSPSTVPRSVHVLSLYI